MKFIICLIILLTSASVSRSQDINSYSGLRDFSKSKAGINTSISGLFISPSIGISFPLKDFRNNSNSGLNVGVKLEFASTKIYPFIIGAVYEHQSHEGNDEFKAANVLGTFQTKISSFGGSVDVVLSKYIRSNFTMPFVTLEVKLMNVTRTIVPDNTSLGIPLTESVTAFTGGAGFTIFIFDIYGTYTYADKFSSVNVKTRFHFPLLKF